MNKLTIAISTIKVNRSTVIKKINALSDITKKTVHFLVISQLEDEDESYLTDDVQVIKSTSKGLSKSRNIAIKEVYTEWVWFQDDDFLIDEIQLLSFLDSLLNNYVDIALIRIGSLENSEKYYKNYVNYSKFTRLLSLKVSSIEIIAKVNFIKKNKIEFDEKLGLGTELPCCEENKFMLDSFDKGANVDFCTQTLCYHTTIPENRNVDYVKNLQAKGYFLKSLSNPIAFILIFKWTFTIKSKFNFLKNFKLLMKGFFL
ncbi:glycosyltransferase [Pseudoalteromonas nigrifaciens]|uniref:glycosyltransferase n=1 Tax=Pseudoalteromonas nigrifaciens TaxID=28109 RepID=UPI003FB795B4